MLVVSGNMKAAAASFFLFFLVMMSSSSSHPVGPDWGEMTPREKFLREHPIFQAFSRRAKPPIKPKNRTMIDMSLAIHSVDFDMSSGTFKTNGYMVQGRRSFFNAYQK